MATKKKIASEELSELLAQTVLDYADLFPGVGAARGGVYVLPADILEPSARKYIESLAIIAELSLAAGKDRQALAFAERAWEAADYFAFNASGPMQDRFIGLLDDAALKRERIVLAVARKNPQAEGDFAVEILDSLILAHCGMKESTPATDLADLWKANAVRLLDSRQREPVIEALVRSGELVESDGGPFAEHVAEIRQRFSLPARRRAPEPA